MKGEKTTFCAVLRRFGAFYLQSNEDYADRGERLQGRGVKGDGKKI